METFVFFIFCSLSVVIAEDMLTLEADRPFLRVTLSEPAQLNCCYRGERVEVRWLQRVQAANRSVNVQFVEESTLVTTWQNRSKGSWCGTLTIGSAQLNDSGLYMCRLNESNIYTHGTYLQVYEPMEKTINLSESTKNKILAAEGVLLLLFVLLPSAILLFKSKELNELEKKKAKKEKENIYQGLNLDDCCEIYEQIECSPARSQYQDVGHLYEKDEDMQLEKP